MDHRPSRVRSNHEGLERMKGYKERRAKTVRCICILNLQHDLFFSCMCTFHDQNRYKKYLFL